MRNAVMTAALLLAAIGASAELPQMLGADPLSRQILAKTAQKNGGVTAAVRLASGQSVELALPDAASVPAKAGLKAKAKRPGSAHARSAARHRPTSPRR